MMLHKFMVPQTLSTMRHSATQCAKEIVINRKVSETDNEYS